MKKIYLLLGTIICLGWNARAQTPQLGIKGGINIANLHYDNGYNPDSKVGAHVGLLAHFHVAPYLAVQPEVVFSMQGAEYGTEDLSANYLNVPFLFQYMAPGGLRLETGPQVGLLLGAEYEHANGIDEDYDNRMKKSDLGWAFGVGFLSSSGLGIDARYNLGLTEVFKGLPNDVTNRVWQFGLFYQFKK